MQDHRYDALFDNNKYYFPPDAVATPRQPGLEVAPERDEQGIPGLQPLPNDEHKYADIALGGFYDAGPMYRTHGAAHADELASQPGMQTVPAVEPEQIARSQPELQPQPQYQWPEPNATQYYGQSFQTLPSSQVSGYSGDNPMYGLQPVATNANAESQYLNPNTTNSPSPSWLKNEAQEQGKKDVKVKRWVLWTIGGIVILLVALGAILGGVLGARSGSHGSTSVVSNTTSNATSSDTPKTTPLQSIRTGSKLAVTGYRTKTDYAIRLFYQDQDHQLRFSDKESSGANWTDSTVLDNLPYQPVEGGAIAAGSYMIEAPVVSSCSD